jgi:DNA-binding CsgD family transcriptional regulator
MTQAMPGGSLTAREREVAGLVAQGLRSRQVADLLLISGRTVDAHLQAIYAKTGTGTRVRLVNWLAENAPAPGTSEAAEAVPVLPSGGGG